MPSRPEVLIVEEARLCEGRELHERLRSTDAKGSNAKLNDAVLCCQANIDCGSASDVRDNAHVFVPSDAKHWEAVKVLMFTLPLNQFLREVRVVRRCEKSKNGCYRGDGGPDS